ncbi:hypothetical protein QUF70_19310, partial [Desulfobacterales bacterium HSG17]|nr:hypothetical protein [Desulfobacterales bacterium HSG17]
SSIGITIESGENAGAHFELEVNFQTGNTISMIVSKNEKEFVASLKPGTVLNNIQYYSPIAVFQGSGSVAELTEIQTGPKKGDFSLDIKIEN